MRKVLFKKWKPKPSKKGENGTEVIEAEPWDQVQSYSQFDEVNYGGQIWVSQINDNLNNVPQTVPDNHTGAITEENF